MEDTCHYFSCSRWRALPSTVYILSGSWPWQFCLGLWLLGSGQSLWPAGKNCCEERARRGLSEALFLLPRGAAFKLRFSCLFPLSYSSCHVAAQPCPTMGPSDPDPWPHTDILAWFQPIPTALPGDPSAVFDTHSSHRALSGPQQASVLDLASVCPVPREVLLTRAEAASGCPPASPPPDWSGETGHHALVLLIPVGPPEQSYCSVCFGLVFFFFFFFSFHGSIFVLADHQSLKGTNYLSNHPWW